MIKGLWIVFLWRMLRSICEISFLLGFWKFFEPEDLSILKWSRRQIFNDSFRIVFKKYLNFLITSTMLNISRKFHTHSSRIREWQGIFWKLKSYCPFQREKPKIKMTILSYQMIVQIRVCHFTGLWFPVNWIWLIPEYSLNQLENR